MVVGSAGVAELELDEVGSDQQIAARLTDRQQSRDWQSRVPVDIALLAMSFGAAPSSTPLGALGMPGCGWHIGLDFTMLLSGQYGVASYALSIPAVPGLVGQRFQHQALVLDPANGNGFGAVVSDAMEGVIGYP